MAEKEARQSVHVADEKGGATMETISMGRDGDRIVIEGRLMGAWLSRMYVGREDTWRMIGMMMNNPAVIGCVFSLPFLLLKRKRVES